MNDIEIIREDGFKNECHKCTRRLVYTTFRSNDYWLGICRHESVEAEQNTITKSPESRPEEILSGVISGLLCC